MSTHQIKELLETLDPEEALSALAAVAKSLLAALGDEARLHFLVNLLGEAADDKVSSLVHL
jgi:hypothetical protein